MTQRSVLILMLCAITAVAQTVTYYQTTEEFIGPFPSWKNVKTDFGAAGNGTTNDAPAIQRALDSMRNVPGNTWSVLYFPSGTYRLGSTLSTTRAAHTDYLGCSIIGEDPATTVLAWAGPSGANMINFDSWYSKVSRLTFDGKGTAKVGLMRDGSFSTYCELSDLWFRDMTTGVSFGGGRGDAGQAEHAVLRCRFVNCGEGVVVANWNSLDLYLWYCLFQDCGVGVHNYMGGYHVYESVFLRSTTADIRNDNLCSFAYMNNTSIGSRIFMDMRGHSWPSPMLIQGNRIYDFKGDFALCTGNAGSMVVIDNVFRGSASGDTRKPLWLAAGDQVVVGNTFTVSNPINTAPAEGSGGRYRIIDTRIKTPAEVPFPQTLSLPGPPQRNGRTVIEVSPAAADQAHEIQSKITAAAQQAGSRVVVQIPKGNYRIGTTIVVPAGKDLQIVGDGGGENGTTLSWNGTGTGPVLRFAGPSRATVRDLAILASNGIAIEDCDQVNGRVLLNQLNLSGRGGDPSQFCEMGIFVDGVENSTVMSICGGFGNYATGIQAVGGPLLQSGADAPGQVAVLSGASSRGARMFDIDRGGKLIAHGYWYEADWNYTTPFIDLRNKSGALTICAMPWAINTDGPFIATDNFSGVFAALANNMGQRIYRWDIAGNGSKAKILNMCNSYNFSDVPIRPDSIWADRTSPAAQAAMLNCNHWGKATGQIGNVTDKQTGAAPTDSFLLACLAQLRSLRIEPVTACPVGVTDFSLVRVTVSGAAGKLVVLKRGASSACQDRTVHTMNAGGFHGKPLRRVMLDGSRGPIAARFYDMRGRLLQKRTNNLCGGDLSAVAATGVVIEKQAESKIAQ